MSAAIGVLVGFILLMLLGSGVWAFMRRGTPMNETERSIGQAQGSGPPEVFGGGGSYGTYFDR